MQSFSNVLLLEKRALDSANENRFLVKSGIVKLKDRNYAELVSMSMNSLLSSFFCASNGLEYKKRRASDKNMSSVSLASKITEAGESCLLFRGKIYRWKRFFEIYVRRERYIFTLKFVTCCDEIFE